MIAIDITLWFTLGTIAMALESVGLAYGFVTLSSDRHREYADVVVVTLIATVAYGLMALGIGEITTATGAVIFVPRYVDWLLTTPLHVVFIALIAGAGQRLIAKAAGLQAATIVLWLVYPVIWLLAPTGYGFMDNETASLVITYIDVVAKVGFGLIALNGLKTLETFDVADATGYDAVED